MGLTPCTLPVSLIRRRVLHARSAKPRAMPLADCVGVIRASHGPISLAPDRRSGGHPSKDSPSAEGRQEVSGDGDRLLQRGNNACRVQFRATANAETDAPSGRPSPVDSARRGDGAAFAASGNPILQEILEGDLIGKGRFHAEVRHGRSGLWEAISTPTTLFGPCPQCVENTRWEASATFLGYSLEREFLSAAGQFRCPHCKLRAIQDARLAIQVVKVNLDRPFS
jgi:hypothetical protein